MHLFELEDQPWFPGRIRDAMTDFLSFTAMASAPVYRQFAKKLAAAIQQTEDIDIVELCAGGGGHGYVVASLAAKEHGQPLNLVLTDLYPNVDRMRLTRAKDPTRITYVKEPIDAQQVPRERSGFRLICNGFHHLPPTVATACLADAVAKHQGIAVVELVERSPLGFFQVVSAVVAMGLFTPWVRPFRWSRLLFTYVVPIIPLATLWDGCVSCLRIYSPQEMRALVAALPENDYEWDIGRLSVPKMPARVTYLIGRPR